MNGWSPKFNRGALELADATDHHDTILFYNPPCGAHCIQHQAPQHKCSFELPPDMRELGLPCTSVVHPRRAYNRDSMSRRPLLGFSALESSIIAETPGVARFPSAQPGLQ